VQNETADEIETTADSFLNWVRDQEYQRYYSSTRSRRPFSDDTGETQATAWINFFTGHIGKFLRNGVIYGIGMIPYYQPIIFTPLPQREVLSGIFQVRLAPIIDDSTSLGKAYDENDPDHDLNLQFTHTYGWAVNDGEEWFLIEYHGGRLMWITVAAIIFDPQVDLDKDPSRQISDPLLLSPGRNYLDNDLLTIIGLKVTI
jgi:hypothetical protein